MRYFVNTLFAVLLSAPAYPQEKPLSPKETVSGDINGVKTEIVYCRPSARGRKMVGGKDPYGQVWRTGAYRYHRISLSSAWKGYPEYSGGFSDEIGMRAPTSRGALERKTTLI